MQFSPRWHTATLHPSKIGTAMVLNKFPSAILSTFTTTSPKLLALLGTNPIPNLLLFHTEDHLTRETGKRILTSKLSDTPGAKTAGFMPGSTLITLHFP
jgi:hypothetical protein